MTTSVIFSQQKCKTWGMELTSHSVIANSIDSGGLLSSSKIRGWNVPNSLQVSWGVKPSRFFLKVPSFYVAATCGRLTEGQCCQQPRFGTRVVSSVSLQGLNVDENPELAQRASLRAGTTNSLNSMASKRSKKSIVTWWNGGYLGQVVGWNNGRGTEIRCLWRCPMWKGAFGVKK